MKVVMRNLCLCCALASACVLGCGGDKDKAAAPAPPPPAAPAEAPAPTTAAPQPTTAAPTITPDEAGIVHLTASDQMRYSAGRINVKVGQPLTIELKNAGTLPKEAMGHNLVVLKPGTDAVAFATKGIPAKATDYVAPEAADQVIAHTKLLGPGESDTIKIATLAAGTYPFVCTFPGHAAIMNGQLFVE